MKYLDLFSGIGGFHLGLLQAGFEFDWAGHSEIDKYAKQIYKKHFPQSEDLGDVKTITIDRLPERINLITFGFPCQDISIAGKRGGLGASRSGLFFEAMRIISECKPDIFIFENVKGLFSSSEGRDFEIILRTIADIGLYDCEWQLLNTRWFLPQNRERIYFIGHLRGKSQPKVFPIGEGISRIRSQDRKRMVQTENSISGCVKEGMGRRLGMDSSLTLVKVGTLGKDSEATRVYSPMGCARTIKDGGGMGAKTGLYAIYDAYNKDWLKKDGTKALRTNEGCHTAGNLVNGIRRLTPVECARLQGFPDNWHEGLSDTQAYKCYGNAVSVPVVRAIGEKLL